MDQQTDQINSRMEQLQTQLAQRDQLRQTLTQAQDTLRHEDYRLDVIEAKFDHIQDEICKLESLSVTGLMSSLLGTKTDKLGSLNEESQALEQEHRECDQAVLSLKQQVEQLTSELAAYADIEDEYKSLMASAPSVIDTPSDLPGKIHRLEQTIEAGSSLITLMSGAYGICNRLRRGPDMLRCGGLLTVASKAIGSHAAGGVAGQVTQAVGYFCDELNKLGLNPEVPAEAETIAEWARLDRFNDPATLGANATANDWAELETIAACIVTDLQERLAEIQKSQL